MSIPLGQLAGALDLGPREMISIVGGGGKTTTMFALGQQLRGDIIMTTTTKLGRDQTGLNHVLIGPTDLELSEALAEHHRVVALGGAEGQKALGITPEAADRWFGLTDHMVIEADGARHHPFKAPKPYEPVIASKTTLVLAIIGADALGRVIVDQCFRPMRVAAIAGCQPGERLTPERAATVLLSERGSRKNVPVGARFVVVITKVNDTNRKLVDALQTQLADRAGALAPSFAINFLTP